MVNLSDRAAFTGVTDGPDGDRVGFIAFCSRSLLPSLAVNADEPVPQEVVDAALTKAGLVLLIPEPDALFSLRALLDGMISDLEIQGDSETVH